MTEVFVFFSIIVIVALILSFAVVRSVKASTMMKTTANPSEENSNYER